MSDILAGFHFQVEWGGTRMGFQTVSGLEISVDVIHYREGNAKEHSPKKMPGQKHYGDIKLSRGVAKSDNEFFEWWNSIKLNTVEKRDIAISLLNENHEPVIVWKVREAFPVKVKWGDLRAAESEAVIEHLVISCEGITVQAV